MSYLLQYSVKSYCIQRMVNFLLILFIYWYREEDEIQVQKAIDEVWLGQKTNVDCLEYNIK